LPFGAMMPICNPKNSEHMLCEPKASTKKMLGIFQANRWKSGDILEIHY